jgi:hypothetical protein
VLRAEDGGVGTEPVEGATVGRGVSKYKLEMNRAHMNGCWRARRALWMPSGADIRVRRRRRCICCPGRPVGWAPLGEHQARLRNLPRLHCRDSAGPRPQTLTDAGRWRRSWESFAARPPKYHHAF